MLGHQKENRKFQGSLVGDKLTLGLFKGPQDPCVWLRMRFAGISLQGLWICISKPSILSSPTIYVCMYIWIHTCVCARVLFAGFILKVGLKRNQTETAYLGAPPMLVHFRGAFLGRRGILRGVSIWDLQLSSSW